MVPTIGLNCEEWEACEGLFINNIITKCTVSQRVGHTTNEQRFQTLCTVKWPSFFRKPWDLFGYKSLYFCHKWAAFPKLCVLQMAIIFPKPWDLFGYESLYFRHKWAAFPKLCVNGHLFSKSMAGVYFALYLAIFTDPAPHPNSSCRAGCRRMDQVWRAADGVCWEWRCGKNKVGITSLVVKYWLSPCCIICACQCTAHCT